MARSYLTRAVSKRTTPQSEALPGSTQVANSAGGFSWEVDKWKQLERFLVLGAEDGTYYIKERDLVKTNVKSLEACIAEDGLRAVKVITEISDGGRAPKNDPALFALAVCMAKGNKETKQAASAALLKVARIGTHLFHFAQFANALRGWGPVLRNAVADWYLAKEPNKLAYQLVKYQSRDGWSHKDLLRLAHPKPVGDLQRLAFNWAVGKEDWKPTGTGLAMIGAFEEAKTADEKRTIELIAEHNLPRECVKTEYLKSVKVWEALLEKMPLTAMIRNLGNMTALGLLAPNSAGTIKVVKALADRAVLKKARIHPLAVLTAQLTYKNGRGLKGSNTWTPVALEAAFYLAFDNVPSTEKRYFIGQDVSGSMTMGNVGGVPNLTPAMASAALAMVTYKSEPFLYYYGFGTGGGELDISRHQKLASVLGKISNINGGGTDCALPMIDALKMKMPIDQFVIYTDSETWAGDIHPSQALNKYREKMGIPARLVVVGMEGNGFTIADPNDAGMLDVVGFDTTVPAVIADFATDGGAKAATATED